MSFKSADCSLEVHPHGLGAPPSVPRPQFHVPSTSSKSSPEQAAVSLGAGKGRELLRHASYLQVNVDQLKCSDSTDNHRQFLAVQMPRSVANTLCGWSISIDWNDQGWGNRKGRLGLLHAVSSFTPTAAEHKRTFTTNCGDLPFRFGDCLAEKGSTVGGTASTSDDDKKLVQLEFFFVVGGGGGHTLTVHHAAIRLYTLHSLAYPTLNMLHLLKSPTVQQFGTESGKEKEKTKVRKEEQLCTVLHSVGTKLPHEVKCHVLSFLYIPLDYLLYDHPGTRLPAEERVRPSCIPSFSALCSRFLLQRKPSGKGKLPSGATGEKTEDPPSCGGGDPSGWYPCSPTATPLFQEERAFSTATAEVKRELREYRYHHHFRREFEDDDDE